MNPLVSIWRRIHQTESDRRFHRRKPGPFAWMLWRSRWYRRWIGGYWACWYIDHPICSEIWWHESELAPGSRPSFARGTPMIENYNLPKARVSS